MSRWRSAARTRKNLDNNPRIREGGRRVRARAMVDCEHFFDGYKANPAYALACTKTAFEAGARWVVLCDTNGGTQPGEIREIVSAVIAAGVPGANLGIHAHNDTGQAVANSLAAVEAGVRQIQGTLNGIGERCGNANLVTLIATLALKETYSNRFETGIDAERLQELTKLAHAFDELLNRSPDPQAPYVGASAFATKAGIHASALLKDPRTYEHVAPESVGNLRKVMVSDQGGRPISSMPQAARHHGLQGRSALDKLISIVKEREATGYAYEVRHASFTLLAKPLSPARARLLPGGELPRQWSSRRFDANGKLKTVSEAVVRVIVAAKTMMSVAEGHGPVNALDLAFARISASISPRSADLELADYKVRILNGGTEAVTRVLIESTDAQGALVDVGVSDNIIDPHFRH